MAQRGEELLGFGSMFSDKTRRWVRVNAPDYVRWCRQNAQGNAMVEFQEYCKIMDEKDFGGPVLLSFGSKHPNKTREWVRKYDPGFCQFCRGLDTTKTSLNLDDFVAYLDKADAADRAAAALRRTTTPSRRAAVAPAAPGAPAPAARPPARSRSSEREDSHRRNTRRRLQPAAAIGARQPVAAVRVRGQPAAAFRVPAQPAAGPRAPAHWKCGRHGCHLSKGPLTVGPNGEAHNFGRQFFLCPKKTPADDCSLQGGFRWADGSLPFSDTSCRRAERYHGRPRGSVVPCVYGVGAGGAMVDYADRDDDYDDGALDELIDQLVCPTCNGGLPGVDDRGFGDGVCDCHPCEECGELQREHELSEDGLCERCRTDECCKRPECRGELDYAGHFCKECGEAQGTSDSESESQTDE